MRVARLELHDFRSYPTVDVTLAPGTTAFIGLNGQGKTNLVEAVDYLATLASHRVATDAPLVRAGAERAVVRAEVVRGDRTALLEVELTPGAANRARVNRSPLPRTRDLLGWLRSVVFSPEDLALVKGDPGERRRFLDQLLTTRAPRLAGVRADYDKVLRQRNSLLKSARGARRGGDADLARLSTLEVWDEHLVRAGAELVAERLALVVDLGPHVEEAYAEVAVGADPGRSLVSLDYRSSFPLPEAHDRDALAAAYREQLAARRGDELDRGVSLVGPHRDDLALALGDLPAKGYASHGESWSYALALKLGSYALLRADGDDPVLILDDVFAELDRGRREALAGLVSDAEQVLVTAAVVEDVPAALAGERFDVSRGVVSRAP